MTTPSLLEFARAREQDAPRRCWACNLPPATRTELAEGYKDSYSWPVLTEWLWSLGFPEASKGKLEYHFTKGRHDLN